MSKKNSSPLQPPDYCLWLRRHLLSRRLSKNPTRRSLLIRMSFRSSRRIARRAIGPDKSARFRCWATRKPGLGRERSKQRLPPERCRLGLRIHAADISLMIVPSNRKISKQLWDGSMGEPRKAISRMRRPQFNGRQRDGRLSRTSLWSCRHLQFLPAAFSIGRI